MIKHIINNFYNIFFKNKYIILIIILALFLRLYNLHNSIDFAWDQERDAFAVKQLLIEKKPILIGPRVVGETGFMLAPHFFYILVPFYLITNLHQYATILFITFYVLLFLITSFLIIKNIYSKKTAYLFIYIWSILSLAISIDTISWNPLLVPFLLIFLLYLLNSLDFNKTINWLFLGIYLGFSFNIHVQLIILCFISLIFILTKIQKIKFVNIIFLTLGFVINFIPLVIFDLRHNFLNLNLLINFFNNSNSIKNPTAFIPVWTNYISGIFTINSKLLSISFWLMLNFVLYKLSKKNIINKILFFTWLFFPIIFIIYGKRPSEYYFNFCLPIIILVFSQLIANLKINSKVLLIILSTLSILLICYKFKKNNTNPFSLANKIKVVKYISKVVGNNKFNISYNVTIGQNNGYSYLMEYYKIKPTNNFNDPLIEIIIPSQIKYPTFGGVSIKIPPSFNK